LAGHVLSSNNFQLFFSSKQKQISTISQSDTS
jgi:hypothetical protein